MAVQHPEAFIAPQTGIATVILGEPGITKTRGYEAFATNGLRRKFKSIVPSQMDPADIIGYPSVGDCEITGKDGKTFKQRLSEFVPTRWRVELENCPEGGFLLLDEITDCSNAHQTAIQQTLNDGIPNCLICGCGNPVDISTNGFEMSAAVVNRLCVLDYSAPVDEWKRNLMTDFAPVSNHYPILPVDWKRCVPEARGLVLGFLEAQPQEAQKCPEARSAQGKPWPSLRSWTNAATLIAAVKSLELEADKEKRITRLLVKGCVGDGATGKFFTWVNALDLPPVLDVLANPEKFDFGRRGDRTYAMISGIVGHLVSNLDEKTWKQTCEVLVHSYDAALAVSASAAVHVCRLREQIDTKPNYPRNFIERYGELFQELGRR